MQLLSAAAGFDWTKLIGIPSALVAVLTLLYFFGLLRPLAVKQARYWHEGDVTRFSCSVKNRSRLYEQTMTGITLVRLPGRLRRLSTRWRRIAQTPSVLPWGPKVEAIRNEGVKISKNDEVVVDGELRGPDGRAGRFQPGDTTRIEARAGSKRSRSRRLQCLT